MAIHPIEFRYGTPEMKKIWDAENKLQKMLEVEAALAEAESQLKLIPKEAAEEIKNKANTQYVTKQRVMKLKGKLTMTLPQLLKHY